MVYRWNWDGKLQARRLEPVRCERRRAQRVERCGVPRELSRARGRIFTEKKIELGRALYDRSMKSGTLSIRRI
jgi:hypothetical protein